MQSVLCPASSLDSVEAAETLKPSCRQSGVARSWCHIRDMLADIQIHRYCRTTAAGRRKPKTAAERLQRSAPQGPCNPQNAHQSREFSLLAKHWTLNKKWEKHWICKPLWTEIFHFNRFLTLTLTTSTSTSKYFSFFSFFCCCIFGKPADLLPARFVFEQMTIEGHSQIQKRATTNWLNNIVPMCCSISISIWPLYFSFSGSLTSERSVRNPLKIIIISMALHMECVYAYMCTYVWLEECKQSLSTNTIHFLRVQLSAGQWHLKWLAHVQLFQSQNGWNRVRGTPSWRAQFELGKLSAKQLWQLQ